MGPGKELPSNAGIFADLPETPAHNDASLHRVVIVGGGAAGLELAARLGREFGKRRRASITLVDRSRTHIWKPLLHEVASGSLNAASDCIEYIAHAPRHHYRYRIGEVVGIDRAKRKAYVAPHLDEDGRQVIPPRVLGYDTLVMAVGSVCNDFGTPGAARNATALDSAEQAIRFNNRKVNACLRALSLRPSHRTKRACGRGRAGASTIRASSGVRYLSTHA